MTYTRQELDNLDLIRRFRATPMAERKKHTVEGYASSRHGLHNLAALTGDHTMTPASIPDRVDEVIDLIAHEDRVWGRWIVRGTHAGNLLGIPPTGKPIEMLEMGSWRITDGRISEGWFMADELALVNQLGLTVNGLP